MTTIDFFHLDSTYLTAADCDPANVGTFYQTLVTAAGCDSVLVTTVSLLPTDTTYLTGADCNPANVGTFYNTLTNQYGCDSLIVTTIDFFHLDSTYLTAADCDPANVGTFYQTLVTAAGCDSVVITTVSLLPSDTTYLFGTSCNPSEVGVFNNILPNRWGCDSLVVTTIDFLGLDTTYLTGSTCEGSLSGVFTQTIVTGGGCDSVVVTTVALLPSDTVALQSTTCVPSAAGVFTNVYPNRFGCDSTVTETVTLLPSDTTYLTQTTCDPLLVGTVANVVPNQYGCDSTIYTTTTLLPISSCTVEITVDGSTIPCLETQGTLTVLVSVGEAPGTYRVLNASGTPVATGSIPSIGQAVTVSGLVAGNYTVEVSSVNGYSTTGTATIVQLTPPELWVEVSSDYSGYDISCVGSEDGSAQAGSTGGVQPYSYVWSTGDTGSGIEQLGPGVYTVTVTDANDCTDTGTVTLTEPTDVEVTLTVSQPDCFGRDAGTIIVNATGGAPPYQYSLNGGPLQTSNTFTNLPADIYTLDVYDANDCGQMEAIAIQAVVEVDVELGGNVTILLGDSATIEAIVNVPYDSLASLVWMPPGDPECPTCPVQTYAPLITTALSISVIADNGCRDEDNALLIVDRRRFIYAPTAFAPESNENNLFRLFAKPGTVHSIKAFQVYDRWGEPVHVAVDVDPYDLSKGWDGLFRGEKLNPGVYVWYAEIEFLDGVVELFKGDVTLLR